MQVQGTANAGRLWILPESVLSAVPRRHGLTPAGTSAHCLSDAYSCPSTEVNTLYLSCVLAIPFRRI